MTMEGREIERDIVCKGDSGVNDDDYGTTEENSSTIRNVLGHDDDGGGAFVHSHSRPSSRLLGYVL